VLTDRSVGLQGDILLAECENINQNDAVSRLSWHRQQGGGFASITCGGFGTFWVVGLEHKTQQEIATRKLPLLRGQRDSLNQVYIWRTMPLSLIMLNFNHCMVQ